MGRIGRGLGQLAVAPIPVIGGRYFANRGLHNVGRGIVDLFRQEAQEHAKSNNKLRDRKGRFASNGSGLPKTLSGKSKLVSKKRKK